MFFSFFVFFLANWPCYLNFFAYPYPFYSYIQLPTPISFLLLFTGRNLAAYCLHLTFSSCKWCLFAYCFCDSDSLQIHIYCILDVEIWFHPPTFVQSFHRTLHEVFVLKKMLIWYHDFSSSWFLPICLLLLLGFDGFIYLCYWYIHSERTGKGYLILISTRSLIPH